ncbi:hypothetical protein DIPPA_33877 [Diplonema papillatum]|nr:hypothetical protein DIPPA_33877 [Diplonema papillatum]
MSEKEQQLQALVGWHMCVHSPDSGNDQRVAATKRIEEAKEVLGWGCAEAGLEVARRAAADVGVAFFGLVLCEHAVRRHADSVAPAARAALRTRLLEMSGSFEARVILEKLAAILSALAACDWPAAWPEFIPHIRQLLPVLKAKTLQILLEDVKQSASPDDVKAAGPGAAKEPRFGRSMQSGIAMSTARRRELITEIRRIAPDLIAFLKQEVTQFSPREGADSDRVVELTVECMASLVDVVDTSVLVASGMIPLVCSLATGQTPGSRKWSAACEALRELASMPVPDGQAVAALIQAAGHITREVATGLVNSPCTNSDDHAAVLLVADFVSTLLAQNWKTAGTDGLADLLRCTVSMLKVPSLPVGSVLLPGLHAAFEGLLRSGAPPDQALPEILSSAGVFTLPTVFQELLANHISNPDNDEGLRFPIQSWSEDFYEDEEPWAAAFADARRTATTVLSLLAARYPDHMLFEVTKLLRQVREGFFTRHPADPKGPSDEVVSCSRLAVAWESTAYITSSVLQAWDVFGELGTSAVETEFVQVLSAVMFEYPLPSQEGLVVASLADMMAGAVCVFKGNSAMLDKALDRLFTMMNHRRDFETGTLSLTPNTELARNRVLLAFNKICRSMTAQLVARFEPALARAGTLVQNGGLLAGEQASLYEGLIRVANAMPPEGQAKVHGIITEPSVALICEPEARLTPPALFSLLSEPLLKKFKFVQLFDAVTGSLRSAKGTALQGVASRLLDPVVTGLMSIDVLLATESGGLLPADVLRSLPSQTDDGQWKVAGSAAEQAASERVEESREFLLVLQTTLFELLGLCAALTDALWTTWQALSVAGSVTGSLPVSSMAPFLRDFAAKFVFTGSGDAPELGPFVVGLCRFVVGFSQQKYLTLRGGVDDPDLRHSLKEVSSLGIGVLTRVSRDAAHPVSRRIVADVGASTGLVYLVCNVLSWSEPSPSTAALLAVRRVLPLWLPQEALHRHLFLLYASCLRCILALHLSSSIRASLVADSANDKLASECVSVITSVYAALSRVHLAFSATLQQAGVPGVDRFTATLLEEPSEGRRVTLFRSALAQHVAGRNASAATTPVMLHLPSFAPLPDASRSCFDPVNTVPIGVE